MGRTSSGALLQGLLVLLLASCVAGVLGLFVAPPIAGSRSSAEPGALQEAEGIAADPAAVASVHGQILLEVFGDDDAEPPELVPPDAGACRVRAWQAGVLVAEPGTCDAEGRFALSLHAGVAGPTAFELEVPGHLRAVVEADVPAGGKGRLPVVALGIATTVRGQVVDGRGAPQAGVTVEAMPNPNLSEPEPWRATTDATGFFTFDTLPPGPVALRCAPEGFDATVVEAIAPQDDILITIEQLLDLTGRVMAGPIDPKRIQVRVEGSGVWPAKTTGVDGEGRFTFSGIPDGVYAVEAVVSATEDDPREYASIPLENVAPDLEVTLALVPAIRVQTRVVGPGGDAVASARVSLMSSQVGLLGRVAETDADGRAAVGPVVPGPYVLRADAEGFLSSEAVLLSIPAEGVPEQTLRLSRPGRIEGIVVDAGGRPVAGAFVSVTTDALWSAGEADARAEVFRSTLVASGGLGVTKGPVPPVPVWGSADPKPVGNARADDDGRFVIRDLVPGSYTLQALHGDFAASAAQTVKVRGGETRADVRLVLRSGHPLTGRVVDGNGRPVARATVALDDGSSYTTDRRGVFDAGLRRGPQVVVARKAGLAPGRIAFRMPARAHDVELVLTEADARLQGRVEDPNGQPVENAQVTVQLRGGLFATRVTWSDERGLWSLTELPTGRADVEVEHMDFLPVRVEVEASASAGVIDVVLEQGWSVEVDVRHYGSGEAIAGAAVTGGGLRARTNGQGTAQLGPLAGDRVKLEIRAADFPPKTIRVPRPVGTVAEVAVDLVEGGSLSGVVTDYRGDPVAGARVVVRDADSDDVLAQVRAGAGGRFAVDGIPAGDLVLEAFPPAARRDELAEVAQRSDVLRGRVTRGVDLRFDRR